MSKAMVHKVLAEWRIRAIESGYIQEIEPDCLAALEPEANAIPAGASNEESANEWLPAVIEAPHPTPERAEPVYGNTVPAPMQVPDRAVPMSAAGRA